MKLVRKITAAAAAAAVSFTMLGGMTVSAEESYVLSESTAVIAELDAASSKAYTTAKKMTGAKYDSNVIKMLKSCEKKKLTKKVKPTKSKTGKYFSKVFSNSNTMYIAAINKTEVAGIALSEKGMSMVSASSSEDVGMAIYIDDKGMTMCDIVAKQYTYMSMEDMAALGMDTSSFDFGNLFGDIDFTNIYVDDSADGEIYSYTFKNDGKVYTYEKISAEGQTVGVLYNEKGVLIGMSVEGDYFCMSLSTKIPSALKKVPSDYTEMSL